ncbi:mechanosensitive ion channel family protein [Caulobacter sp. NIBR2454]|uniref:mechanosensitive ion channel family protein n=1 Tax=Caulobacter sp. NIBR2454 TaxID=3015996 RepID=UPI0022B66F5E|nr:mechanosensitive ion channel domain-containing protein [Caulobacter sp. NIBR2454]
MDTEGVISELSTLDEARLLNIGGSILTLGGLVSGAVIVALAILISWLLTRGVRRMRLKAHRSAQALYLLEKLAGYGIVIIGVFVGLSAAGLNLSSLAVFAGAIGIGVGLGLQGVVKEFVSGIFLIFDRMVSVGDYVELEGGTRGAIAEIGPRATRIRTNDNVNVIIPNSHLIEGPVTNWTLKGDTRRIHIPFSVAYGANRGQVREAVLEAAKASPFTLPETEARKSQVWLVGFGDSSLNFELLVWPTQEAVKRPAAMHAAYTWAIADALDAAGIEVPFPQTDLRIRSVLGREGDDALKALGLSEHLAATKREAPADGAPSPAPTVNDAAADLLDPAIDPVESPEG